MKVVIAGSRDINDCNIVEKVINLSGIKEYITEIVSGHAKGIDSLGEEYAKKYNIPIKIFEANWNKFGKSAGPIRNEEMARYGDFLIAITNGSKGTANMITNMKKVNKEVFVYNYSSEDEFCSMLENAFK